MKCDWRSYHRVDSLTIFGFFDEYRFLSNFHLCSVLYDGVMWPSSEHAYMAAKCFKKFENGTCFYDKTKYKDITNMSCAQVKRWGEGVVLRDDWENVKTNLMYSICLDKFTRNTDIRKKLNETENKTLIEANDWGDSYWGFDVKKNKGKNYLGQVLMKVRDVMKNDL